METILSTCLAQVSFGELQQHGKLGVLPLLAGESGPEYLTLGQALATGKLKISEVDEGGSVPELKVSNETGQLVLLVDGEELAGAKQNRILNTSILLAVGADMVIPVSCTEQGRWHSTSALFAASGEVSPVKLRSHNKRALLASLAQQQGHRTNQAEVWHDVAFHATLAEAEAPTGAMHDVYRHRAADLQAHLDSFACLPEQQGALVFLNGTPVAVDLFSRREAYAQLHPKLIRSYALEAMHERAEASVEPAPVAGERFLQTVQACPVQQHPAVGCGEELHSTSPDVVGSALVFENCVIHAAFFAAADDDDAGLPGRFASYRQRRASRMGREGE